MMGWAASKCRSDSDRLSMQRKQSTAVVHSAWCAAGLENWQMLPTAWPDVMRIDSEPGSSAQQLRFDTTVCHIEETLSHNALPCSIIMA
jgi:hypothetical protein